MTTFQTMPVDISLTALPGQVTNETQGCCTDLAVMPDQPSSQHVEPAESLADDPDTMPRRNTPPTPNPLTARRDDQSLSFVPTQTIFCGDNLPYLKNMPDECADLVYIDPPFNSNRNYEVFWGETGEVRAFEDRHESTRAYIDFMRPRCKELWRILRKTGSLYYHCDWHASHYVKVMLDQFFGENNFQNEIVWKRSSAHSDSKQGMSQYGRIHDSIFFYTKGAKWTWN